jgi:hypothetical protein
MNAEQKEEIMRRYCEGMHAMSDAQMLYKAAEQSEGMRQRRPLTSGEQESMRCFWGGTADEQNNFVPQPRRPTLRERLKLWVIGPT